MNEGKLRDGRDGGWDHAVPHRLEEFWVGEAEIRANHLGGRDLHPNEVAQFASLQVTETALTEPWPIRADRVVLREDGLFDFADEGIEENLAPVFTIAVFGLEGMNDIVAWQPRTNHLNLWLGRGFALGETEIWAPRIDGEALSIWRSPLGWLRSGRKGVVILRPAAAPFYFDHLQAVLAEDLAHGEELEKVLRPPQPRTKILLPSRIAQPSRSAA